MDSFRNHRLRDLTLPTSIAWLFTPIAGVSLDVIRDLLDRSRRDEKVKCLGTGLNARWKNVVSIDRLLPFSTGKSAFHPAETSQAADWRSFANTGLVH